MAIFATLAGLAALLATSSVFAASTNSTVTGPAIATGNNDPCTVIATQGRLLAAQTTDGGNVFPVVTADEALACYNSFSVSPSDKAKQVNAVKSYFQMYPYLDIAKKSEPPNFPSNIDLFAGLDALANDNTITTEYQLHSHIQRLVSLLNDNHAYYKSECFTTIRFLQPFVITAKYPTAGGAPTFNIKGSVSQASELFSAINIAQSPYLKGVASSFDAFFTQKLNGIAASNYTDYTITSINGMDTISFVQHMADLTTGISHDPQTRFNAILANAQYIGTGSFIFSDSYLYRTRFFNHDFNTTYTYGLLAPNGTKLTISVPWGAYLTLPTSVTQSAGDKP
ncbi:hypothetical protein HDU76_004273, partial [Blyttiomyces sp. JEL0837]